MKLQHSLPIDPSSSDIIYRLKISDTIQPKNFVIVDTREFMRGCLSVWLNTFNDDLNLVSVADVTTSLPVAIIEQATVIIVSANTDVLANGWLNAQIVWLRAIRPDVPIIALVELNEMQVFWNNVIRFELQGYILTSSSMEVATAILHLVTAGGTYVPQIKEEIRLLASTAQGRTLQAPSMASEVQLTPRERCVLELLERGMANKIIAYRLGLSQSTVKAHVHNIISKLKVRNRTEAAVAAFRPPMATSMDCGVACGPSKQ